MASDSPITDLLAQWRAGHHDSNPELAREVYAVLAEMAEARMRRIPSGQTLDAAALVNEAVLRLLDAGLEWNSRAHFYALASLQMRSILVDHARRRSAEKRGGGLQRVTLGDDQVAVENDDRLLALNASLDRLADAEPRTAKVVELCYFGGMTAAAIAEVLGVGIRTVERDLGFARAWLRRELEGA
jgi:RNA polymerase sigma factor (TIGR02999 family)